MKNKFFTLTLFILSINLLISQEKDPNCITGNCENGYGTYKFTNGDIFTGDFANRKMIKGRYSFHDGGYEKGNFVNNMLNGDSCIRVDKNKLTQEGTFKVGKLISGKKFNDNMSYEGKFDSIGRLQGEGIYKEGKILLKGIFVNNKLNDVNGFIRQENNAEYKGGVKNNTPHGKGELKTPDGSGLISGLFIEGQFQTGFDLNDNSQIKSIPLINEDGVYYIIIDINGTKIKTVFDTGASYLSIDNGYLYSAKKDGMIAKFSTVNTIDANNNVVENDLYFLANVKIGDYEAYLVPAIGKSEGKPSLFGLNVLKRLGTQFMVDFENDRLIIIK